MDNSLNCGHRPQSIMWATTNIAGPGGQWRWIFNQVCHIPIYPDKGTIHKYMHTYKHTYIHTYIHIYIYTYIHIQAITLEIWLHCSHFPYFKRSHFVLRGWYHPPPLVRTEGSFIFISFLNSLTFLHILPQDHIENMSVRLSEFNASYNWYIFEATNNVEDDFAIYTTY